MPAIDLSADAEPFFPTEDSKPSELLPTDSLDWDLWLCDDESSPLSSPSSGSSSSKRKSDDTGFSSEDEFSRKRVRTSTSSSSSSARSSLNRLRLPHEGDEFLDFCGKRSAAFVDKTRFPFQLPDNYQYLLLRPPQFGKTVFLSMLSRFYDVYGVEKFPHHFKTLEAVHNRLGSHDHSQHLCLPFTFANTRVYMNAGAFADQLQGDLFFGLQSFLVKYARKLGLSDPHAYLLYGENESLKKVLDLVKACGHTLFVAVDSYDAPLRQSMMSHLVHPAEHHNFVTLKDVEELLDLYFWGPLQRGCDVITKLFVTGTLSLQTPILQNLVIPAPNLQTCCGFTEDEALQFARSALHETIDVNELRGRCGDYYFSSNETSDDLVLHPQLVIDCIYELSSQQPEGHPFHLLSSLLDILPMDSDIPNTVTLEALVELIVTGGVVDIEGDLNTACDLRGTSVFWSALHRAGALTRARSSKSTFRIATREVLSLIHSRIDRLIYDRYRVFDDGRDQLDFLTALSQYDCEQHEPLLNVLSKVLRDQSLHSLGRVREPNLQGVLELIMRNVNLISCQFSELPEPIILLPAGTTFVRVVGFNTNNIYHWRLTTLTLLGMWQGAYPNETEPSVDDLRELQETLCEEDEEKLLARPYRLWSDNQTATTVSVGSFFKAEAEYAQLIAVGGARILRRGGSAELSVLTSPEDEEEQYERAEDLDDYYIPDIIPDLYS